MSSEFEEFVRLVIASGTLQAEWSDMSSFQAQLAPKEVFKKALSVNSTSLSHFLSELSEGRYDSPQPKLKVLYKKGRGGEDSR